MALHRDIDPGPPDRDERIEHLGGMHEHRDRGRSWMVASGTFACPVCDVPVVPLRGAGPATTIACGWCEHVAVGRDFLTINADPRPTRVDVIATLPLPA
jgi:hypothetical protein